MTEQLLRRRLSYFDHGNRYVVDQKFLQTDTRSIVLLGEAGMGKSTLLEQLRGVSGFFICTARKLVVAPDPTSWIDGTQKLVIDALDEVSAQREGDAVDRVLRRLVELGLPRFILSCRVADWRSATALQGIADFYDRAPVELHLEPLDRDDAITFLSASLGRERSEETIEHFEQRGLSDLWRNPQTLELVAKVAEEGKLPLSKGQLFADATKLLRVEHRSAKSITALAKLPENRVLDSAGAGFAALIIADKEALSRDAQCDASDAAVPEIAALPGAENLGDVLGSRLLEARAPERFTYAHRAIGEFLGARWLAREANTPRKQRRILELLNNHALVPANLRGIHAWLAWHSPELADAVIASDPMGVVEYGDADTLTMPQGKALLNGLFRLSKENPRFRDWTEYRAGGLVQPGMLPDVRQLLRDEGAEFGLRLLVLEALKGSTLTSPLYDELLTLLRDSNTVFALRSEAGDRLVEIGSETDWPSMIGQLIAQDTEDSARLASEMMFQLGYGSFSDELILETVKAQLSRVENTVGVFFRLERNLPDDRLDALLDGIAAFVASMYDRLAHRNEHYVTDLVFALLAKRLKRSAPSAEKLWSWLEPFNAEFAFQAETRKSVSHAFETDDDLRHAVQRYALLDSADENEIWERSWRMIESVESLRPTEEDVVWLLEQIEPGDPRWRELVELTRLGPADGSRVLAAAARFVKGDAEASEWLAKLTTPEVPEWRIKQQERKRERSEKRESDRQSRRTYFAARIDSMRGGEYGLVVGPAKAYLKLFDNVGYEAKDGSSRLEEWLGIELRDAALEGFDRFLTTEPPCPTASDIATACAEGERYDAAYIIVSALAERVCTARGLDDIASERLMAGYFQLLQTHVDEYAGIGNLTAVLIEELRARGDWEATFRLYLEPQFAAGTQHVIGLNRLLQSDEDFELADRLGCEWLERFPQMSEVSETELIDRLLASEESHPKIRALLPHRLSTRLSDYRRTIWDATGIIVDFDRTRSRLEAAGSIDSALLWSLRARLGDEGIRTSSASLNVHQLAWAIATFRPLFPYVPRPVGETIGNANPWDATVYLLALINRLGGEVEYAATEALVELRDARRDEYTYHLRIALAEQKRKRVEAEWIAPDISAFLSTVTDRAPTTAPQLQVVLLEELDQVQKKITGHPLDWYKDFFSEEGAPRDEETCRDTILKIFGAPPFGIQASPEGHLADDKRCDIECTLPEIMVPVEIKGQWHKDLWTAADQQLDRLYTNDWRAERSIYLVLWFGVDAAKKLTKPPAGVEAPKSADELRNTLADQSVTTREGRTEIVVLDCTRPD